METVKNEGKTLPIEITLQGSKNCISVSRGVIRALGRPTHVSIKVTDKLDSISFFPCDENDDMSFRVPSKFFTDHSCMMRINSKQFIQGIMRFNNLDTACTYTLTGMYLPERNAAVFSLTEGVILRSQSSGQSCS